MNTLDLSDELERLRVPKGEYSIGREKDNAFVIVSQDRMWRVYFVEKGIRSDEAIFKHEADACDYFLREIRKYASNLAKF
jgi:hypothetical protein